MPEKFFAQKMLVLGEFASVFIKGIRHPCEQLADTVWLVVVLVAVW
jgi:hypothetical protein